MTLPPFARHEVFNLRHNHVICDGCQKDAVLIEAMRNEIFILVDLLKGFGVEYPDGFLCFCPMGTGHPSYSEHSGYCLDVRAALGNRCKVVK